jgi:GNAT superfamily N-acetyltransferase
MPEHVEIVPITSRRGVRRFVDVPWRIRDLTDAPQWVAPLRVAVLDALDEKRNPFYRRAARQLFIATRDGRPVGRIAAIENRAHNEFHHDRVGFFGFFESIEDDAVARRLFNAAARWLTGRGLTAMRGPMSPSTNHECGLLVDGFDRHPVFMTPWNPPYYASLIERAGLVAVKDLLGHLLDADDPDFRFPQRFATHAQRARESGRVTIRSLDPNRFHAELELCWEVYNAAWERNWGFVPFAHDEFAHMGKSLKPLLVPELALTVEVEGRPAGFMLAVPDFNLVAKRIPNGRLFPTGLIKLLLGKRRIRFGRIMALGVKREYRRSDVFALLVDELYRRGMAYGMTKVEASWVLEDNELMNRPMRAMGGKAYRRWRIYEKPL